MYSRYTAGDFFVVCLVVRGASGNNASRSGSGHEDDDGSGYGSFNRNLGKNM